MAKRTISTTIKLDGEKEFKQQLSAVNSNLRTLKSEMKLTEAEFTGQANSMEALTQKGALLRQEYEQQEEKIRALEQAVKESVERYGDAAQVTDDFRQSLNRAKTELIQLENELRDNERYLDEARSSADRAATSIDEFGREVKDAGDDLDSGFGSKLTGVLDDLGKLKGALLGGAVVTGLKELGGSILDVEESTREYRQIMGGLEASSREAGYSIEQARETYLQLYEVLGDTQTAATAAANLQALELSQAQLREMTELTIGAWARYGDSIPIDGLGEAINETIRAGEVTGTFADVLNWGAQEGETYGVSLRENNEANKEWNEAVLNAKTAEDYFNLALSDCETRSERVDLVMQAMAKQGLQDVADGYREANEETIKANESQAKLDEAWGKMGEALAPVADFLRNTMAGALEFLAEKIDGAVGALKDLWDWWSKVMSLEGDPYDPAGTLDEAEYDPLGLNPRRKKRPISGSHASGLSRVPYDGYVAQLHRDEMVLTAREADVLRGLSAGVGRSNGITSQDLQAIMAASVNAMTAANRGYERPIMIENVWKVNGRELYRETIGDLREVNREIPEVLDDE